MSKRYSLVKDNLHQGKQYKYYDPIKVITIIQFPFDDGRNTIETRYLPVKTIKEASLHIQKEYNNCSLHLVDMTHDYILLTGQLLTGWQPTVVVLIHNES